MNPNHSLEVQVLLAVCEADFRVDEGLASVLDVDVGSLHPPNQPTLEHEVEYETSLVDDVELEGSVMVGAGAAFGVVIVVFSVVVVTSLHPNHPGVLQVDVELVEVVVVIGPDVVDSSKHPHQPGVLHVSVRVLVDDTVEERVVVVSVLLLS